MQNADQKPPSDGVDETWVGGMLLIAFLAALGFAAGWLAIAPPVS